MSETLTIKEYLNMLGNRIKQYRVNSSLTQNDLYEKTGVSVRTLSRLEQGESVQMSVFLKVINGIGLAKNLDFLIPDQTKRPSFYLEKKSPVNKRVRKKNIKVGKFMWGDEK